VDAAMVGVDPARAAEFAYASSYLAEDMTYLVPIASPIRTAADADRPGVRIAATPGSNFYLTLERELRNAELVGIDRSVVWEPLAAGEVHAFGHQLSTLTMDAEQRPGLRVVEGRFGVSEFAVMLPQGRPAGLAFVSDVVERAKASGLVRQAIERAGLFGVQVAPPAARSAPIQLPRALPRTGGAGPVLPFGVAAGAGLLLLGAGLATARRPRRA
jgi:polar amino acid transport system substrate-binding protein